jgi:hypothetical protein
MKKQSLAITILLAVFTVTALPHNAQAAPTDYLNTVQKLYIGYYQRPADPGGLLFWENGLAQIDTNHDGSFTGEDIIPVLSQFAFSEEARNLYGGDITGSNIATVVDSIYMGLFGRHAEAGGLAFWMNSFNTGASTPATILWELMRGSQGTDAQTVQNRLVTANRFTQVVDPNLDGLPPFQATYGGYADCAKARQWLAGVTWDPLTIPTEDATRALLAGMDITPPTVPANLSVTAVSSSQIDLTWATSTDTVGVAGYWVYRKSPTDLKMARLGIVTTTSYSDRMLSAATNHCYAVSAYDAAGNGSILSTQQCATTLAPGTCGTHTPNGTACNDGSSCTQTDTCQAGVCVGSNPVVCGAIDECHTAGVCDPIAGCSNPDRRTVVAISPTLDRFSLWRPGGWVDLYDSDVCEPWDGTWIQSSEPSKNYCGPTAGMNLLHWYTGPVPYNTYYQLGSEMKTNNWMSYTEALSACYCFCAPDPWCVTPNPLCDVSCPLVANGFLDVGTHPDDLERTLRKHSILGSSVGYLLLRHRGNPGLEALEYRLAQGNPVVVLIWTGETLHWTTVIGTYDQNGTNMVRFANHNPQTWDWFIHQWSFEGLNWPVPGLLDDFGIKNYVWMHYEKTAILTAGQAIWMGQDMTSVDGRFNLTVDTAGHLVLFPLPFEPGVYLWTKNVLNAQVLWMQDDGNLVLRNSAMQPLWQSHTGGHPGAYLALQNDGNLVIYDANNSPIWATDTGGH